MINETILIDDLDLSEYSIYKEAMYQGKPFTGTAIEDENDVYSEWSFVNGNGHGRWYSVLSNGQLIDETFLNNGEVISERIWNRSGRLIHIMDSEPFLVQDFDDDGNLLKEETKEHLWIFYDNGIKQADYDYTSSSVIEYDYSGVWIVKGKLTNGYFVLSRNKMTFNDDYWTQNYISILLNGSFQETYPFFLIWLKEKTLMQSEIVCAMIKNEDLRLKYNAIGLAGRYGIKEAVPLIEKQVSIKQVPPPTENTSYGMSVGEIAKKVLRELRK